MKNTFTKSLLGVTAGASLMVAFVVTPNFVDAIALNTAANANISTGAGSGSVKAGLSGKVETERIPKIIARGERNGKSVCGRQSGS